MLNNMSTKCKAMQQDFPEVFSRQGIACSQCNPANNKLLGTLPSCQSYT